ncbi:MAG: penicillin acylase family protein [Candidatus Hydrogenedentes bacterium]|nr:penicillin acylase family protein [Candidatus Hydrogenedentota bacterium]
MNRVLGAMLIFVLVGLVSAEAASPRTLARQVTIHRDEWGVPHIDGKTDASAVFAVAYAQCEDYFWQVEETYIYCLGRYAEVYGESGLDSDMLHRAFKINERAKEGYEALPKSLREICDAYAAGYNYYLKTHPDVKPRLITKFEPHYMLSFERFVLLNWLTGRAHAPTKELKPMLLELQAATGSNAWAVGPSKTVNGSAMLFINPHQPWYGIGSFTEMHVRSGEGWNFTGSTFPGGPFPSMGHNEYLGWAHTVNAPDVGDVYRVTFDHPTDRLKYRYADGWKDATEWKDTISVLVGGAIENRVFTFRETHYGPVLAKEDNTHYLAVKIARLFDGSRLEQGVAMTKSKNFSEWKAAIGMLNLQMFNTVYADVEGNIFYVYNGTVPRRDTSFDWTKPVDGSDPRTEWNGLHPFAELPQVLNPLSGYVQNCNSTPFTTTDDGNPSLEDFPSYMVEEKYDDKRRAKVSRYLLRAADDLTFEQWEDLCYDTTLYWPMTELPRYAEAFADLEKRKPELAAKIKPYLDHLLDWDYKSTAESTQTSLCVAWYEMLYGRGYPVETLKPEFIVDPDKRFEALGQAAAILTALYGSWKVPYGDVNRLQRFPDQRGPETVPFDDTMPSLPQVGVPGPLGVAFTVYHTPPDPSKPNRMKQYAVVGASYMGVFEFNKGRVNGGSYLHYGQSGDPSSPHFFDQATLFSQKKFKPAWFYWDDVTAHTVEKYHPGRKK